MEEAIGEGHTSPRVGILRVIWDLRMCEWVMEMGFRYGVDGVVDDCDGG